MTSYLGQKRYRRGVGMMLLNADKKILVGQRRDTDVDTWQMPQGGIDSDETPQQAALRELKEEIGTCNVDIIKESKKWLFYDLPHGLRRKLWGGRFYGQKQKWFLMQFKGTDTEINIQTDHPEFQAWKWVEPCETVHLIVYFKQNLYRNLLQEFAPHLNLDRT